MVGTTLLYFGLLFAPGQDTFTQGLETYWKGEYSQAVLGFEQLTEAEPNVFSHWYNYGTAMAQLGRTGLAIYGLERALQLRPSDEDARFNLRLVKQLAIEQVTESMQGQRLVVPTLEQDRGQIFRQYSKLSLNIAFGFAWLIFGLAIFGARRSKSARVRAMSFFLALTFGLLSLGVGSVRIYREFWLDQSVEGIIVEKSVKAHRGPGSAYPTLVEFVDGVSVGILGQENEWLLVRLGDGRNGWVLNSAIRKLPRGTY